MKALALLATGGPDQLELRDMPMPAIRDPGDVLIRIRAVALNRLDVWVAGGLPNLHLSFPHIVG